jgi:death-on-curing protein
VKEPVWLSRNNALGIHEMMLSQHGGAAGVRDEGLLRSALAKPQKSFAHGSTSLPEMAGSYAVGIVLNPPFVDGNKRTGFMLAATFLEINGWEFTATEASVVQNTVALAARSMTEPQYVDWLSSNCKPVDPR